MLEGLAAIDWESHRHAYGSARDVPDLLRAITSTHQATRDRAWEVLNHNVIHQGTVWEVTPYTVPFFLELLGENVPDKPRILVYLGALASSTNLSSPASDIDEPDRELANEYLEAGRGTLDAVTRGTRTLLQFLRAEDRWARVAACFVLAKLPSERAGTITELQLLLARETDEHVRASVYRALGELALDDSVVRSLLASAAASKHHSLERLSGALALVTPGAVLPDATLHALAEGIENPTPVAEAYAKLPWAAFRVELDLCRVSSLLDRSASATLVPSLLNALARATVYQCDAPVAALLHFAFGDVDWTQFNPRAGRRRPASSLTPEQRSLLETFVAKDMWTIGVGAQRRIYGNIGELLNPQQLPADREELREYLAGSDR